MTLRDVTLHDRVDLTKQHVLLSGVQALVRLPLMQKARDEAAGLNTAGYVSGYRGSPLGAVDQNFERAAKDLLAADIHFNPGLNEDLAATAVWGSQQAHLRGEGRVDGVFGMWYGKGPGVDRSGDVFRHANFAGTADLGGVLAVMGDDHTGESSTTLHQSEFALVDVMMPILAPAGVQELLDYGIIGWEMSRYTGCWVGLKCLKDTAEATAVVDGNPQRITVQRPSDFELPADGLNIRLRDTPADQEARLHDYKRFAAEAFGRANKLDHAVYPAKGAKIGIVSSGKSWLDTILAMQLLGIDAAMAAKLGISTYKIGMVWPLDMKSFREWSDSLDLIIVVEEKRKLIEVQIKEAIFNDRHGRRVVGWKDEAGETLFSVKKALDPVNIARSLVRVLRGEGTWDEALNEAAAQIEVAAVANNAPSIATRLPYFCSGCPHNSSTKLPEGARAYAGIGCHYLVQWMDRNSDGFTHMGGEGANWIGEAPFSKRSHIFQNLGDGTYNHSGVQAIRAALASDVNMTYKILYNDAVAMTGGQPNDGGLTAAQIAHEVVAMGVERLIVVHDEKEPVDPSDYPQGVEIEPRSELMSVQTRLAEIPGVTVLLYVQTCAAEKRRRRKRKQFPDPDKRVFINPAVCEGCGDCGVQSNCVSILPLETEFGRKREIDQSSCNKDFSCIQGFCPSFVTLEGAKVKKPKPAALHIPDLPLPKLPAINGTFNLVATGVGGTGIVTVGALLAMAAHLERKGVGMMEMAGLAQKGGAVTVHCRIGNSPDDISAVRVGNAELDAMIGGDIVVSSGTAALGLMKRGRTRVVCNSHQIITGDFTRNTEFFLPGDQMEMALRGRIGDDALTMIDATKLAETDLGDAIYANVLMLGAAWQAGLIPLGQESIEQAIRLNGAGVEGNLLAFKVGRWAIAHPKDVLPAHPAPAASTNLDEVIDLRAAALEKFQNKALANRYRARVAGAREVDADFAMALAKGYHKLLAYKDEYEVARLHRETLQAAVDTHFEGVRKMRFHMAPPIFSKTDAQGRLIKSEFGPWMFRAFGLLARMKVLRGTWADPFGRSAERQMERALIAEYEGDMDRALAAFTPKTAQICRDLAALPLSIKGFGHVKSAAVARAAKQREALLAALSAPNQIAAE